MSGLATSHPSPWSSFASAEAGARRDEQILPLAAEARDRQLAYASADRVYNLQASTADLTSSETAAAAAAALEFVHLGWI